MLYGRGRIKNHHFNKFSTKEDEPERIHKNINKQKDANNEAKYEEYSVTDEVPIYFNIFKCGRNILNRLDVKYDRVCMATQEDEYLADLLETTVEHNDFHKTPFSEEKIRKVVNTIVAETEEEGRDSKSNANNVTTENFVQIIVTTNTPREKQTLQTRGKFLRTV